MWYGDTFEIQSQYPLIHEFTFSPLPTSLVRLFHQSLQFTTFLYHSYYKYWRLEQWISFIFSSFRNQLRSTTGGDKTVFAPDLWRKKSFFFRWKERENRFFIYFLSKVKLLNGANSLSGKVNNNYKRTLKDESFVNSSVEKAR